MKMAEPRVFLVANTQLEDRGIEEYLTEIGNPDWRPNEKITGGENLVEAAGRMCYRSWQKYDPTKPRATNPNVTKVRQGNDIYLENILKSGHGSIFEHVNMTFIATDVSRVFTHELVRHRAGCAYSQESLRYVRLSDLRFWVPRSLRQSRAAKIMLRAVSWLEKVQHNLSKLIPKSAKFSYKKSLTSAFRRVAPIGLATSIMFTMNIRTLRHVISMRTSPHAEEEIREVFREVAHICQRTYPNFFQDMVENSDGSFTFECKKI